MTEQEIDELLQDAIEVAFSSDITLIFPNEHESEKAYNETISFFAGKPVTIKLKKVDDKISVFICDNENRFVKTPFIDYYEDEYEKWLKRDEIVAPGLYMIYNNYNTATFFAYRVTRPIMTQQHNQLNIHGWDILP